MIIRLCALGGKSRFRCGGNARWDLGAFVVAGGHVRLFVSWPIMPGEKGAGSGCFAQSGASEMDTWTLEGHAEEGSCEFRAGAIRFANGRDGGRVGAGECERADPVGCITEGMSPNISRPRSSARWRGEKFMVGESGCRGVGFVCGVDGFGSDIHLVRRIERGGRCLAAGKQLESVIVARRSEQW